MAMEKDVASRAFLKHVGNYSRFWEASEIAMKNSSQGEDVWLVGGIVYKSIINSLYDSNLKNLSFDFIMPKMPSKWNLPHNWNISQSGPYACVLSGNNLSVKFSFLNEFYSIKSKRLSINIDNYLKGVPLTVQSVAYQPFRHRVIGDVGIRSIDQKEVGVNNIDMARHCAGKRYMTLEDLLKQKAQEIGFRVAA